MEEFITVERAKEVILAGAVPLAPEKIAITAALERVLAEDVVADMTIPPLDNSAMDGYALRAMDTSEAAADQPLRMPVVGEIPAGRQFAGCLQPGDAVRIMTGAPIPTGADAVIRREYVQESKNYITLVEPVPLGNDIRYAGEDVRRGETIIAAGAVLTPAMIGMMAAVGLPFAAVIRQPRVAVLATGDELVDFNEPPTAGRIRNSNSYSLAALVKHAGGVPIVFPVTGDDPDLLRQRVEQAATAADLVLTTGGVSMGDYDFVKTVLNEVSGGVHFWKVRMKPGKPLVYGAVAGTPLVGLPGNPVSVMISFEQFVRPLIKKMLGYPPSAWFLPRLTAIAGEEMPIARGRRYFLRGVATQTPQGLTTVVTTGPQGSGILRSMVVSNCLVVLNEGDEPVKKGSPVEIELLDYGCSTIVAGR
ncbi:MAG: molybdopterin molybdotransferase MoeA [Deltaproteobacteria bacterium]|nr:molybdopterin molybdotransferase MoeA [Candidatus Anaeroferrophillus wilburensis]MBN2889847.1 molybdopterin molybdotransferase MoeA [Deltaproteobacteria bacterium]